LKRGVSIKIVISPAVDLPAGAIVFLGDKDNANDAKYW
jgi:hypothetical protein